MPADRALWLGVLNPLVLLHFVSGAHNDALLVGLLVAGLVLVLDRRPALGVAVCSLALLVKAPAALALVFIVPVWAQQLDGRFRLVRAAAATAAVAGAVVGVGVLADRPRLRLDQRAEHPRHRSATGCPAPPCSARRSGC